MKYADLNIGTIEAVVNKLGGMDGLRRFLSGEMVIQVGDFFRETGELRIQIPALPRPTLAELRKKYPWIREESGIERDTSPTEAVTLKLGTVLRTDEERVNGAEYERRIAPKLNVSFGYQQLQWLVDHQDEHPAFKALLGQIYIDGPGLIVVGADGHRLFPYLGADGRRWDLYWRWFGLVLNRHGRLAISGK